MSLSQQRFVAVTVFCIAFATTLKTFASDPRRTPLVEAVQHCQDSVVNIHTEKDGPTESDSRFFNAKPRRVSGMGTGIVVDERGYIVTNYHVIHEVDEIIVTLRDGQQYEARPVSYDRRQDMAIIHVSATKPLTVMNIGTSSDVMLAEQVFAVGNAFGYEHTVTAGIVSALNRDVEVDETQAYEDLIQTDASINPGNSGGPLLNVRGEVIGINVAIRAGAQRIGFAIPIDAARETVARLLSTERLNGVSHGLFGADHKQPGHQDLIVTEVVSGSPADACGLQKGDTIRTVRGLTINDTADWERSLLDIPVGKVLDVEVIRDGEPVALKYTVGVGTDATAAVAKVPAKQTVSVTNVSSIRTVAPKSTSESIRSRVHRMTGMQLTDLSGRDRNVLGKKYNGGMKVVAVRDDSPAERHGIRRGDILLGLDEYETLGDRNLTFILQQSRLRTLKALSFQIFREGQGALVGSIDMPLDK